MSQLLPQGNLLRLMADDQIIQLLKIGAMAKGENGKPMQASTYRFIWQRGTGYPDQRTLAVSDFSSSHPMQLAK